MTPKNPAENTMHRYRILIVDDHAIVRDGLFKIINQEKDLEACGEAEKADEAMKKVEALKPDIVIIDISLEGTSGIELTRNLRERYSDLRILVLSMHKESVYAERALRAGADGYIMKQENGDKLLGAIRLVLDGKTYVNERIQTKLIRSLSRSLGQHPESSLVDRLGSREFEVFRLIGKSYGARQIADELKISIKTVEAHRGHIRAKLNLQTTFELIQYARDWSISEQL